MLLIQIRTEQYSSLSLSVYHYPSFNLLSNQNDRFLRCKAKIIMIFDTVCSVKAASDCCQLVYLAVNFGINKDALPDAELMRVVVSYPTKV
jgi:hypothetical protein